MTPISISDEGFVDVTIHGETVTVDVLATSWKLFDAVEGEPGPDEFSRRVLVVMEQVGFGKELLARLSRHAVDRFAVAIFKRNAELKKKDSGTDSPDSPDTTGPASAG